MSPLEAQILELAGDEATKTILISWHDRIVQHQYIASNVEVNLALHVNGRNYSVVCLDNHVSISLIHSIFINREYSVAGKTNVIYDLGANIGLASIYLHSIMPEAELICVEPSKENLDLLKRNLNINKIHSTVIEGVVSNRSGLLPFYLYPTASVSHSLHNKERAFGNSQYVVGEVRSFRFDEVIRGSDYGVKIDIEGSEHDLAEFPDVVNKAVWIVGEVHYGSFLGSGGNDLLECIPRQRFDLEISAPMQVDDRTNRQFKAVRRAVRM